MYTSDVGERLLAKLDVRDDGCWLFTGRTDEQGYGQFDVTTGPHRSSARGAHRVAYEVFVGPVPDGLVVDHQCHNDSECRLGDGCSHRRCCNPAHLEAVTSRVNILRGRGLAAARSTQTQCEQGHDFTPENTYRRPSNGTRVCRICNRLYKQNKRNQGRHPAA